MFEEKFWLALSFLTFLALIIKFLGKKICSGLDHKSSIIAQEINDAKKQRLKSEELLANAQKIYDESIISAKKIIDDANNESIKMLHNAQQLLDSEVSKMKLLTSKRIKEEEEKIIRDIKNKIIINAINKAQQKIPNNSEDKKLIDKTIINLETIH